MTVARHLPPEMTTPTVASSVPVLDELRVAAHEARVAGRLVVEVRRVDGPGVALLALLAALALLATVTLRPLRALRAGGALLALRAGLTGAGVRGLPTC